jgi:hypothetical protein
MGGQMKRLKTVPVLIVGAMIVLLSCKQVATIAEEVKKGSSSSEKKAAAQPPLEFKDLGFRFKMPGRPWVKLDAQKLNKDATVALMRTRPQIFAMIIAEKSGGFLTTESLAEISKANLESGSSESNILKETTYTLSGTTGIRIDAEAVVQNLDLHYAYWIIANDQHAYQIMLWGPKEEVDAASLAKEADPIFKGFEIIK